VIFVFPATSSPGIAALTPFAPRLDFENNFKNVSGKPTDIYLSPPVCRISVTLDLGTLQEERGNMKKKLFMPTTLRIVIALSTIVWLTSFVQPPKSVGQSTVSVSKKCGSCGGGVSSTAKIGDTCPHCGVKWGYEDRQTLPISRFKFSEPIPGYAEKMAVVWKETSELVLARLAIEDIDADIRKAAVGRMTNQVLLHDVVMKAIDRDVRVMSIWKLEDENVLKKLPVQKSHSDVQKALFNRLAMKIRVIDLGDGISMEFVLIPAGSFTMGSNPRAMPIRKVTIIKPFYLGRYEVTQGQWQKIMGYNYSCFKDTRRPVERVSWNDCQKFVAKLSERVVGEIFRLPTEAEWEYACRAGTTTEYCFGNDPHEKLLGDYAWYVCNSGWTTNKEGYHYQDGGATQRVGERKPNNWGLYDMHGNVSEWCSDFYAHSYAPGDQSDPIGQSGPSVRENTQRGGSWATSKGQWVGSA
jgi:formylglycine-generating enzyme required for sulfatase activity